MGVGVMSAVFLFGLLYAVALVWWICKGDKDDA